MGENMTKFTKNQVKKYFEIAQVYFEKVYPDGATFEQIRQDEEIALRNYLKFFTKNIEKSKDRYNSMCNKARNKWFALETIEKVIELSAKDFVDDIKFCNNDQFIDKFIDAINPDSYQSYLQDDDLSK